MIDEIDEDFTCSVHGMARRMDIVKCKEHGILKKNIHPLPFSFKAGPFNLLITHLGSILPKHVKNNQKESVDR